MAYQANSRTLAVLLAPFTYGIVKSKKAIRKLQFAETHLLSGYARPMSVARNFTVPLVSALTGVSFSISLGTAIGSALGSVVPIAGNILGGLIGAAIGSVLGSSLGAFVTKQAFRLGNWIYNKTQGREAYSMTNSSKYQLNDDRPHAYSTAREVLKFIGASKNKMIKSSSNAPFIELTGAKSLCLDENQMKQNQCLDNAARAIQENPEDPAQQVYAAALLAEAGFRRTFGL